MADQAEGRSSLAQKATGTAPEIDSTGCVACLVARPAQFPSSFNDFDRMRDYLGLDFHGFVSEFAAVMPAVLSVL